MFSITKPSEAKIQGFLARQATARFSYSAVGLSADAADIPGYVSDHTRVLLGHGEAIWVRAVEAVRTWQMFKFGWLQLCWPSTAIAEGSTVAIAIRHFGFWSLNAARIVYVINESGGPVKRYGFAYGTLADHGESGEERFSVEWNSQDDSVWYDLFAFSRPRALSAKLAYPMVRWLQGRFREDSKRAMTLAVADSRPI